MPSVFIPTPRFPAVPQLPGVPQLVRAIATADAVINTGLLIAEAIAFAFAQAPVWGVFDQNNVKVVNPDNIYAFNERAEWRVSDYTIQSGGFSSYNRVTVPFENSVRMTKGGTLADRKAFLKVIDDLCASTDLVNIVTPEKTYLNVTPVRRELTRRSSEGAYFLEIDLHFRNINENNAQYSTGAANVANAINPPALPAVNLGNVQLSSDILSQTQASAAMAIASAPL